MNQSLITTILYKKLGQYAELNKVPNWELIRQQLAEDLAKEIIKEAE